MKSISFLKLQRVEVVDKRFHFLGNITTSFGRYRLAGSRRNEEVIGIDGESVFFRVEFGSLIGSRK